jgi:hypothetical protein
MQQVVVNPTQMFAGGVHVWTDMEHDHHGYCYCWCCYSQKEILLHDLQLKRSLPFPFYCCLFRSSPRLISHVMNYFIHFPHGDMGLFVWLVADVWCWFVLREKYCCLVVDGWFVLREKYCWLVADKPSEQADDTSTELWRLLFVC